jgi:predicted PurR-regulated permease PerM
VNESLSTRSILRVVVIVVLSAVAMYLVFRLRKPITWIVIGAFLAVALSAPVDYLQRRVRRRGLAIGFVYVGLILVPITFGAILVPPIVQESQNLVDQVPSYVSDIKDAIEKNRTLRGLEQDYDITGKLQDQAEKLPSKIGDATGVLSDIGLGIVNSLFALITILILSAFMISGGGNWVRAAIRSRPPNEHEMLERATNDISRAVIGYVIGAAGQAFLAGVLAFIVLSILGVPYAAALALIIALLDLVPLVGATIGALLVGLVTVFNDFPTATIIWAIWSIVYQQIENSVIQPRIQARTVNIQPIVILIAVLFGSALFGVLGALLAIPAAATIQISLREYRQYRQLTRVSPATVGAPMPPSPAVG